MGKVAKVTKTSADGNKKVKNVKGKRNPGQNVKKASKLRGARVPLMKSLKKAPGAKTFQAIKKSPQKNRHARKRKLKGSTQHSKNQVKLEKVKPNLNDEQVTQAIKAVLALATQEAENKKELFEGEQLPILLQVSSIKIAKVPTRKLRITLPHTLVTDTDDVALFVRDMQKGRGRDFEPTKEHYQDILRQHGCTCIKEVIPMNQVKTEYGQYELKRKLLSTYDYFLTDGRIAGHLSHMLGKAFSRKRKLPTSVRMDSKDLKHEIEYALRRTSMSLHSHGSTHTLQVGHSNMSERNILENVLSLCNSLATHYPGGWANVRSLFLKTQKSMPVPVYVSLKNKNEVNVTVIKAKRPKAHRAYEGELSTLSGDASVIVKPDGTVTMTRKRATNKDSILSKTGQPAVKKAKLKKKASKEEFSSEPEDEDESPLDSEDEIADVEESYLSQWQQRNADSLEEPVEKIKKGKKEQNKLAADKSKTKSKTVLPSKQSQQQQGIVKKGKKENVPINTKKQKMKKNDKLNKEPKKKVLAKDKSKKSKVVEEKRIVLDKTSEKSIKKLNKLKIDGPDVKSKMKLNRKEELIRDYLNAEMLVPKNKVKKEKGVPNVVSEKAKKSKTKIKSIKRLHK